MSGLADFGSFFPPAAASKFFACGGLWAITFPFFRLRRSITFPKKSACGGLRAITFPFFHLRWSITFPKKIRLRRAPGQHISIFSPPTVNHFFIFSHSWSITFPKKSPSAASVNHFSIFSPPADFRPITFPLFTFGGQSLFQKIASGGIFGQSLFHFLASGGFPTFDFQSLSISKI